MPKLFIGPNETDRKKERTEGEKGGTEDSHWAPSDPGGGQKVGGKG